MEGFKGTKGPWIKRCQSIGSVGTDRKLVHMCMEPIDPYHGMDEEDEANVNLIAAAPELLEALQDMLSGWKYIREQHGDLYGVGWERSQQKAELALAKALGQ